MKITPTLLGLSLVVLSFSAFGQSGINDRLRDPLPKCDLTLRDSPNIRGLHLGMSESDFRTKLDTSAKQIWVGAPLNKLAGFEHIESIWFDFYRDTLMHLRIDYDRSVEWANSTEFAAALSGPLHLPANAWVNENYSTEVADMDCGAFRVLINSRFRYIELTDKFAEAAMKAEAKQKELDKKKAFKP